MSFPLWRYSMMALCAPFVIVIFQRDNLYYN